MNKYLIILSFIIIKNTYSQENSFEIVLENIYESFSLVKKNEKYGILNSNKILSTPIAYDRIDQILDNGFARVMKGNKYGFLSIKDNVLTIPIEYDNIEFHEASGLAYAMIVGAEAHHPKKGFINFETGEVVVKLIYDNVSFNEGKFIATINGVERELDETGFDLTEKHNEENRKNEEERKEKIRKEEEIRRLQLERIEQDKLNKRNTQLRSNKLKINWKIGDRMCVEYNGGTIEGSLEQWNEDKTKFKVKIIGGQNDISYKGEQIYKGNFVWIDANWGWYKCIGDENVNYELAGVSVGQSAGKNSKYKIGDIICTSTCYNYYKRDFFQEESGRIFVKLTASVENVNSEKIQIKVLKTDRTRYNGNDCIQPRLDYHIYNIKYGDITLIGDETYWIDPNKYISWTKCE